MPWKTVEKMTLKREFVELASQPGANISELCRRYGISRPTGYEWLNRWRENGLEGLEEKSRRPVTSPGRTEEGKEQAVLGVRAENPVWGGRKIRRYLRNKGIAEAPAASTITEILRRHGKLGGPEGGSGQGPWKRFERDAPNDLWQMDFKGHFATRSGQRCHPFTVLDDHSRFNLVLGACGDETGETVRGRLREAFERYGLPVQILCDNGSPWGALERPGGHSKVEVWLLELGVEMIHGRPYHPQTQGKEERFHRTLEAEVIGRRTLWKDLEHCGEEFASWRMKYNHERPHESIDDRVPGEVYRPSGRLLPEELPVAESHYLAGDEIRRVKSKGEITFRNHFFYVGGPFAGKPVALRPRGDDKWDVFYCWKRLGEIDLGAVHKQKYRYHPLSP